MFDEYVLPKTEYAKGTSKKHRKTVVLYLWYSWLIFFLFFTLFKIQFLFKFVLVFIMSLEN